MSKKVKRETYLNNPNLPTVDAQFEYTPVMVKELKKCRTNILHFAENYFYIVHPDEGRQTIQLHSYQKKTLRMIRDNRFNILLFSRQTGKSTIATVFLLWHAIFNDDQHILLVANKEDTAKEIFSRVRLAFEQLPNWLKPGVKEYGKEGMELANGSKIKITTTTSSAGRGSTCNVLFIDEADYIEHNLLNPFWASVYPIISASSKSKIIMASTPRDTSGLFYRLYQKSISGDPENVWASMKVPWYEVPGRNEKWARQTRAALDDPEKFETEFGCVFRESGDAAIDTEYFETLMSQCIEPLHILEDGHYKIWQVPQEDRVYSAGVDVAEGVGRDASCVQIFDITDPTAIKQVAQYHNNTIAPAQFVTKLHEILQNWGNPLALIERNSCGSQIVDNLRKYHNYENIVSYGKSEANRKNDQLGIICHTNTKNRGLQNFRYWLNVVKSLQIYDIETVREIKTFVRQSNGTWGAQSGKHDDRVMSMVWSLMLLSDDLVGRYFDVLEVDENRKPLIIKQLDYGIKYYMNPTSIYSQEDTVGVLPAFMGGSNFNIDVSDLHQQGWSLLGDFSDRR